MPKELDVLNKLFTSRDSKDIIKFYDHFDNAESLINWAKNRPSAAMKIYEVEGNRDIVIVIPTADHNSKLAKNCAENIFKGQQIIFIESYGPFFNYARSCNFGLKYALKYNPKWIVLSNDDMYKIDDISVLKDELLSLDSEKLDLTFSPINYKSYLVKETLFSRMLSNLSFYHRNVNFIKKKFGISYRPFDGRRNLALRVLYKKIYKFYITGPFTIFSSKFIQSINKPFDEIYINDVEDIDLCLRIMKRNKFTNISFKIGSIGGRSLGTNKSLRGMRTIFDQIYLDYKIKNKTIFNYKP